MACYKQCSSVQFIEYFQNVCHMTDTTAKCRGIDNEWGMIVAPVHNSLKGFTVMFIQEVSHCVCICFAPMQFEFPLCQDYFRQASPSKEIEHSLFLSRDQG